MAEISQMLKSFMLWAAMIMLDINVLQTNDRCLIGKWAREWECSDQRKCRTCPLLPCRTTRSCRRTVRRSSWPSECCRRRRCHTFRIRPCRTTCSFERTCSIRRQRFGSLPDKSRTCRSSIHRSYSFDQYTECRSRLQLWRNIRVGKSRSWWRWNKCGTTAGKVGIVRRLRSNKIPCCSNCTSARRDKRNSWQHKEDKWSDSPCRIRACRSRRRQSPGCMTSSCPDTLSRSSRLRTC